MPYRGPIRPLPTKWGTYENFLGACAHLNGNFDPNEHAGVRGNQWCQWQTSEMNPDVEITSANFNAISGYKGFNNKPFIKKRKIAGINKSATSYLTGPPKAASLFFITRQCQVIEARCLSMRASSSSTYALLGPSNIRFGINFNWTRPNFPEGFGCLRWQYFGSMVVFFLLTLQTTTSIKITS